MTWQYATEQLSRKNYCSLFDEILHDMRNISFPAGLKNVKKLGTLSLALMVISKCTLRLHLEFDRHRSWLTLMTVHELYEWRFVYAARLHKYCMVFVKKTTRYWQNFCFNDTAYPLLYKHTPRSTAWLLLQA